MQPMKRIGWMTGWLLAGLLFVHNARRDGRLGLAGKYSHGVGEPWAS